MWAPTQVLGELFLILGAIPDEDAVQGLHALILLHLGGKALGIAMLELHGVTLACERFLRVILRQLSVFRGHEGDSAGVVRCRETALALCVLLRLGQSGGSLGPVAAFDPMEAGPGLGLAEALLNDGNECVGDDRHAEEHVDVHEEEPKQHVEAGNVSEKVLQLVACDR